MTLRFEVSCLLAVLTTSSATPFLYQNPCNNSVRDCSRREERKTLAIDIHHIVAILSTDCSHVFHSLAD